MRPIQCYANAYTNSASSIANRDRDSNSYAYFDTETFTDAKSCANAWGSSYAAAAPIALSLKKMVQLNHLINRWSQPSHLCHAQGEIQRFASSGWVAYLFLVRCNERYRCAKVFHSISYSRRLPRMRGLLVRQLREHSVGTSATQLAPVLENVVADAGRGFLLLARDNNRIIGVAYVAERGALRCRGLA